MTRSQGWTKQIHGNAYSPEWAGESFTHTIEGKVKFTRAESIEHIQTLFIKWSAIANTCVPGAL